MGLEPGLVGSVQANVDRAMTAHALGSGDLEVLGTPAVLALVERAAMRALEGRLEPDQTTVGSTVELRHVAPTPVGETVEATARLASVEGRRLQFEVRVVDRAGTVAEGRHGRVIVDRERFSAAARER